LFKNILCEAEKIKINLENQEEC